MRDLGLYIHIPFCKKKCNYCDFVSYTGKEYLIDEYVEVLCKEIKELGTGNPSTELGASWELATVYFGGGTPSLLEVKHYEKILKTIEHKTQSTEHLPGRQAGRAQEITIEANPGTADKTKLKALRQLGINRISIGAQSFNDRHLKSLARIHNSKQIFKFYDDARSAGFENINLDLIFALPDQTLEQWQKDLQTATSLKPEHLSTYNLQIEEGTIFGILFNPHPLSPSPTGRGGNPPEAEGGEGLKLPAEEIELAMYEYTIETLTAKGYKHYEISNFARPGYECLHNINYWKNGDYIGVGAGAHSHVNGKRWSNPDSIEEYLSRGSGTLSAARKVGLRPQQARSEGVRPTRDIRETLFMGLRLLDGLETDKFKGFEKEVKELIAAGLLIQESNRYKLTRQGLYLGNEVFARFV